MKSFKWILLLLTLMFAGCGLDLTATPKSNSGVAMATAKVVVQSNGLTTEQDNVSRRLEQDNMPGAIKHLYVISAYSGQVIIYSTVKGKVTSSSKRLTPSTVVENSARNGMAVTIDGERHTTEEVLQDDGTYGSSVPYIYWWDVRGSYHQHYIDGGQIVHISDRPMPVKSITINMELVEK